MTSKPNFSVAMCRRRLLVKHAALQRLLLMLFERTWADSTLGVATGVSANVLLAINNRESLAASLVYIIPISNIVISNIQNKIFQLKMF